MAVKYEFLSQSIKTGSFIYVNISNRERDLEVDEENEKCLTSVNRNQSNNLCVEHVTKKLHRRAT